MTVTFLVSSFSLGENYEIWGSRGGGVAIFCLE